MLQLFFDSSGTVHMEFIPEEATVNKHHYKQILRRPCNSIRCKRPELWRRKNWLLLYDREKLTNQQVTTLPHPPDT
jgi:hypothetical protein